MRLRDIPKPPTRRPRAPKPSPIPLTGEPRSLPSPKRPAWVRWIETPTGPVPIRIPGFLAERAPRGHVAEGSPEEATMKRELGL